MLCCMVQSLNKAINTGTEQVMLDLLFKGHKVTAIAALYSSAIVVWLIISKHSVAMLQCIALLTKEN